MKYGISFLLILFLILTQTVFAQDSISVKKTKKKQSYLYDTRHWKIEIPIWIPGYRGEFSYGDVSLEGEDGVDPSPENPIEKPGVGDVFKRLFKTKGGIHFFLVTGVTYSNKSFYSHLELFSGTSKPMT